MEAFFLMSTTSQGVTGVFKLVCYIGFFRFKGARVPHRLCIKGWHPLREGVTGATRVPQGCKVLGVRC